MKRFDKLGWIYGISICICTFGFAYFISTMVPSTIANQLQHANSHAQRANIIRAYMVK